MGSGTSVSNMVRETLVELREHDICPKFSSQPNKTGYTIKYTIDDRCLLAAYFDNLDKPITEQKLEEQTGMPTKIYALIDKMHELGYFHGDLTDLEIQINKTTFDVKIVGFTDKTLSRINHIDEQYIHEYNKKFDVNYTTVAELINHERNLWREIFSYYLP